MLNKELLEAAEYGNVSGIQRLIELGADVNYAEIDPDFGYTPLIMASSAGGFVPRFEHACRAHACGWSGNAGGFRPPLALTSVVLPACARGLAGETGAMRLLLQLGANVHDRSVYNGTALHYAGGEALL